MLVPHAKSGIAGSVRMPGRHLSRLLRWVGTHWTRLWQQEAEQRTQQAVHQRHVAQVVQTLAATTGVRCVTSTLQVEADIAYWYRFVQRYHGYLLYARQDGKTVLMDRSARYVEADGRILFIEGVEAARHFVDALRLSHSHSCN